jgi:hypothetical protein
VGRALVATTRAAGRRIRADAVRRASALVAAATAVLLAAGLAGGATAPARAAETSLTDAVFRWGVNDETGSGAFAPGTYNLLSAGAVTATGPDDRVTSANWKRSDGDVRILKRQVDGSYADASFAGLRTDASGTTVNTNGVTSGHVVEISGGIGAVDPDAGTASIRWTGTFTVAYYSGMTRFWVVDPRLEVAADGTGTVTATLGGYATSMDDPTRFEPLAPVDDVVIARLSGVTVGAEGIEATPVYRGVPVEVGPDGTPQLRSGPNWGSFPQSFVDFQNLTGQNSYWYSSGLSSDARKIAAPIVVSYAAAPPEPQAPVIRTQPASVRTTSGLPVTFSVSASGDGLGYRWQEAPAAGETWTDVPGATGASLALTAVTALDGRRYRAVVTGDEGEAVSDAASLAVGPKVAGSIPPPFADLAALTAAIAAGDARDGTATASGAGAPIAAGGSLSLRLPWAAAVAANGDTTAEVWLYPGRTLLGEFTVAGGTASFARAVGDLAAGRYTLLFAVDRQRPVAVSVEVAAAPVVADGNVEGAVLRWGVNAESGAGAFFGGCNFLSAGAAGSAGSARVWTAADVGTLYRAQDGNVRIERPTAGGWEPASWGTRCAMPDGRAPSVSSTTDTTGAQLVLTGGTGTVDAAAGTATISWAGSFTVAFYGGLTYWTATDPVLTLAGGVATLTATAGGYGASMDDLSHWTQLRPRTVVLATMSTAAFEGARLTATPDYLGVAVSTGSATAQVARDADNAGHWGAFPQSFVDFQVEAGQASYWYASGGARDRAKPPTPITVCTTADCTVAPTAAAEAPAGATAITQRVLRPPRAIAAPVAQPAVALAAAPAETVVIRQTMRPAAATIAPEVLVLTVVLLGLLALVTVIAAVGGGLFAAGTLGPPRSRPPGR